MNRQEWVKSIDHEVGWWIQWLETKGLEWPDEYRVRCDPLLQLSADLTRHLGEPREISVLDVGSGPMTSLGKRWGEHQVYITACDALADEYAKLPYPAGLPLVPVVKCDSERLGEVFGGVFFDLVHARNTLDHGYDPMGAILEMVKRAKPGGIVVLDHHPNEATKADHVGLHQFDFCIDDGRLLIKGTDRSWDVFDELRALAHIDILEVLGNDQCFVVLRSRGMIGN